MHRIFKRSFKKLYSVTPLQQYEVDTVFASSVTCTGGHFPAWVLDGTATDVSYFIWKEVDVIFEGPGKGS